MTANLPATLIEAEAFALARDMVRDLMESRDIFPLPDGALLPVPPLHPEAGRMVLRYCVQHDALISEAWWLDLMHTAELSGDSDIIEALDEIRDAYLNRSREIPAFIATYTAKRLRGHIRPRGGKSAAGNYVRDICVVTLAVKLVEHFPSLKFTRGQDRRSRPRSGLRAPSACSIIHRALFEARVFHGNEAALNRVFRRFKDSGWLFQRNGQWVIRSVLLFGRLPRWR